MDLKAKLYDLNYKLIGEVTLTCPTYPKLILVKGVTPYLYIDSDRYEVVENNNICIVQDNEIK